MSYDDNVLMLIMFKKKSTHYCFNHLQVSRNRLL